jgi:aspartate 1-decarboxylase
LLRTILKSKIHRARVTQANLDYEGSITIDTALLDAADILPFEQVHVLDVNNGARFQTYTIPGGPGEICVNGAAARLVSPNDIVIILAYAQTTDEEARLVRPRLVYVDSRNAISALRDEIAHSPDPAH